MTTPRDFAIALLSGLGASVDNNNVTSIVSAEKAEGGFMSNTATYNPLNVTQAAPGSKLAPGFSTTGPAIQAYPDWNTGLQATIALLKNGLYNDILGALSVSSAPETTLAIWARNPHYGWTFTPAVDTSYGSEAFPTGPSSTALFVPLQAPSFGPNITQAGVGAVLAFGFWKLYEFLGKR